MYIIYYIHGETPRQAARAVRNVPNLLEAIQHRRCGDADIFWSYSGEVQGGGTGSSFLQKLTILLKRPQLSWM
jgi:hypothetical protein